MDEEGRRLAAMSDAEWERHVAALARSVEEDRRPPRTGLSSTSRTAIGGLVVLIVIGVAALLLVPRDDSGGGSGSTATPHESYRPGPPFVGTPAAAWSAASVALRMPAASPVGSYSSKEVAGALDRARTYLLTMRTDERVLGRHDLTVLAKLVASQVPKNQPSLYAAELAAGNTLAAPVRAKGTVTMDYTAAQGRYGPHLTVSANVIWAYALRAGYAVEPTSKGLVIVHDKVELGFYLDSAGDGPHAKVVPQRDESTTFDGDCGFAHDDLIGLPRVDDPRRTSGGYTDDGEKYRLGADLSGGSQGCR